MIALIERADVIHVHTCMEVSSAAATASMHMNTTIGPFFEDSGSFLGEAWSPPIFVNFLLGV